MRCKHCHSFELTRSAGGALLLLVLCGCRAGYDAPRAAGELAYGTRAARADLADWDDSSEDLGHRLARTVAGKVLLKALDAHGGWDRWRALNHVEFRRRRVGRAASMPRSGVDVGEASGVGPLPAAARGAAANDAATERRVTFNPRAWGGVEDEDAWLFSMPFLLLRGGYIQEYLGVEISVPQQQEFQKMRFVRSGLPGEEVEQFVAYFDASSGLLHQLLLRRARDHWLLIRFSGWETVAGLRLATRRVAYRLETMFRRPRPDFLIWRDTLGGIKME